MTGGEFNTPLWAINNKKKTSKDAELKNTINRLTGLVLIEYFTCYILLEEHSPKQTISRVIKQTWINF